MLPPPVPVKLSLPLGPNPMTDKQQEAINYVVDGRSRAETSLKYTQDLKARLVNASIDAEAIMTGRAWGTPGPPVPHLGKLEEYYSGLRHALPTAIRKAVEDQVNMTANYSLEAAINATAYFRARLGAHLSTFPNATPATNVSNATNASNASNATNSFLQRILGHSVTR
jgi:hypothetical protein